MKQGNISVNTRDIFPIIKRFLYTDHEIFLRELISNAVDATKKIKILTSKDEYKEELGELKIVVKVDKKHKTLSVIDRGIGMTEEEIDKYINQIAFSSAEEFIKKYEQSEDNKLIGHFGLGFYSAFMVSDKVEIITKSYQKDAEAVQWVCSGSTEYEISSSKKTDRGTEIILHISSESKDFLEDYKISSLLEKYCKFLPIEIEFGTETTYEKVEGEKDKDGKDKEIKVEKPQIINNTHPIWNKKSTDLTDKDYIDFYNELYPFTKPPLFWIHLNVDYPFNLTGILYFPKVSSNMDMQRNKIKLYSNQVYVSDTVDDIVPEYLTLLHGVIDSPDIPLNVSRSSLQSDSNVKKISTYIVKKVAEKLQDLFKANRKEFEDKWDDIGIFVKFGALSDEKFYEKAEKFLLLKDIDGNYFTFEEYKDKTKINQQDKEKNLVWLYTFNRDEQHAYIDVATKRGFNVLIFNEMIDSHYINLIEQKQKDVRLKRIDSATIDELIDKGDKKESVLSQGDIDQLIELYKEVVNDDKIVIKTEPLSPDDPPLIITQDEFGRRMNEMSKVSGWGGFGDMPSHYGYVINTNHILAKKVMDADSKEEKHKIAKQVYDLARLSGNLLKGKELTDFISRSVEIMKEK